MLEPATDREREALRHLSPDRNFQVLKDWFSRSLDRRNKDLHVAEGVFLGRCQGAAQTLEQFLESAKSAVK